MNERIRLLAEQAGLITLQDDRENWDRENWHEYINDVEKFAESIVRECIQFRTELTQFDNTTPYGDGYENGLNDMAELIAEHFGVE